MAELFQQTVDQLPDSVENGPIIRLDLSAASPKFLLDGDLRRGGRISR